MNGLPDLVQSIMSAPFEARGWHDAIASVATATRSSSGQIIGIGPARAAAFNLITNPVEPTINRRWEREMADYSRSNWRIAATGGVMEVRHEHHYDQIRTLADTSAYDAFCHEGNMPYGCQTMLHNQGGLMIGLATLRSYEDGPTLEEDRAVFAALAPHVMASVRMQRTLEQDATQLVAGSLGAMSVAAFLCDRQGKVGAMTAAAEAMLADGTLVTLRDRELAARRSNEHRALRSAITALLHGEGHEAGIRCFWLGATLPLRDRRLCEVFRLARREFSFGFDPHIMVTIRTASDISAEERDAVRGVLGLTAAEADIAIMLAEGLSRDAIAAHRGTSSGTVSVQIKRLFEKTGATREAELVALVRRLLR